MLKFTHRLGADFSGPVTASATLPLDTRIRSRARFRLDDGREAGFVLPRGQLIRGGEVLADENGYAVRIRAANDHVSTVACADSLLLARVCYHLGNRHVPLQIEAGFVRYMHDHVLDEMVRGMGLDVVVEKAPFEPEAGAYQSAPHGHHHHHHDDHDHDHDHDHGHDHGHGHGHGHGHRHVHGHLHVKGPEHVNGHAASSKKEIFVNAANAHPHSATSRLKS